MDEDSRTLSDFFSKLSDKARKRELTHREKERSTLFLMDMATLKTRDTDNEDMMSTIFLGYYVKNLMSNRITPFTEVVSDEHIQFQEPSNNSTR